MSPVDQPHEPFDDTHELEAQREHDEATSDWPDVSDDADELPDGSLVEMFNDSIGDDWEFEDFESENDFYDELRERYEDDEAI